MTRSWRGLLASDFSHMSNSDKESGEKRGIVRTKRARKLADEDDEE